jgi:predicted transcriptional regulator
MARYTRRSESLVIEEALEQYLEVNEWQLKGIEEAVSEADAPDAVFVDHEEVLARVSPTLEQRLALFDPVKHGGEAMAVEAVGTEKW